MQWSKDLNRIRRLLRWFLQVDVPAPLRPDAEVAAEVVRNYPWNFAVQMLDFGLFWFSASFASSATIIPLFASKLTGNTWVIGLIAVVAQGGWYLPQLFTANWVERLARKKPVVVNVGFFAERLPFWLLVAAALMAMDNPGLALVLLLIGWAWHNLGAGAIAPAWQDLVARCFPVDRRGRFFGVSAFLGAGAGALGAGLSTWLLGVVPFPKSFLLVFGIAAVGITLSWVFLALTREPVQALTAPRKTHTEFFSGLPALLGQDLNFRRFLFGRMLLAAGNMGMGFVTVAAIQRWHVSDATVGVFTAAMLIGQTGGNLAFGFLADRFGHLLSLRIGAMASCLAFLVIWLAPWAEAYVFGFAMLGVGAAAVLVSGILVVLEFAAPERRPTYVGIANSAVGAIGILAPLLGATLAGWGFDVLFAVSAATCLGAAVAFSVWVLEPRSRVRQGLPQNGKGRG